MDSDLAIKFAEAYKVLELAKAAKRKAEDDFFTAREAFNAFMVQVMAAPDNDQ